MERRERRMRIKPSFALFVLTSISIAALAQSPGDDDQARRRSVELQIEEWKRQVARNPQDYKVLTAIATAYGSLGRYSESIELYREAIAIRPAFPEAHLGLAITYGFLGRQAEKINECKAAIRLRPKYAEAHESLGISYGRVGRYPEAIRELKTALELDLTVAQQADAHFALGLAYAFSGQFPAALTEQDALMRLDSRRGADLKQMIARVLAAAVGSRESTLRANRTRGTLRRAEPLYGGVRTAIAKGLTPDPPQLARHGVGDDPEATTHWKISHEIRFTGMPGFGRTLSDREIWQLTLFLKRMDSLPPGARAAWASGQSGSGIAPVRSTP